MHDSLGITTVEDVDLAAVDVPAAGSQTSKQVAGAPAAPIDRLVLAAARAQAGELSRLAAESTTALAAALASRGAGADEAVVQLAARCVPRWHFAMLNDTERNDALAVAVERLVRPGMHVLDIGAGTGLLAMMAARAGAGRVTSCEANPLLAEIARQLVAANGMSDVVDVVAGRSTDLMVGRELARPADLIVSEIVDCGLVGEGLLPTIRHARHGLLTPGGQVMPQAARLFGFLIESPVIIGLNRVTQASGFDVRLLNATSTSGHFPVRLSTWPHRELTPAVDLAAFDLATGHLGDGSVVVRMPVTHDGTAQALVVWFELDLGAGITIRNSPDNLQSHWMQALVPLPADRPVTADTTVELRLTWHGERLYAG